MSIASISVGSLAANVQQTRRTSELGAGPQTTVEKAANATLGAAAPQSGSTQSGSTQSGSAPSGSTQASPDGHHHTHGSAGTRLDTQA